MADSNKCLVVVALFLVIAGCVLIVSLVPSAYADLEYYEVSSCLHRIKKTTLEWKFGTKYFLFEKSFLWVYPTIDILSDNLIAPLKNIASQEEIFENSSCVQYF